MLARAVVPDPCNPYPELPRGALRDLLAVTRMLYRATAELEPQNTVRLQALEQMGRTLQRVLKAACQYSGSPDHQTAWSAAERVTRELQALVAEGQLLAPLVDVTAKRVSRRNRPRMVT